MCEPEIDDELDQHCDLMRASWNAHAEDNPMFFINTLGRPQHDPFQWNRTEFYASGADVLQFVDAHFPDPPFGDKVLLEIGCGIGRQTVHLAPLFRHVIAVDISNRMLDIARRNLSHVKNVSWLEVSGADLAPVASSSCDVAYSFIVFQHITDVRVTQRLIREASRVLKPGGSFIFQVRNLEDRRESTTVWEMTDLDVSSIRTVAESSHLRVEKHSGVGTHYLWLVCTKDR